jgi:ribosomal protein S14
MLRLIQPSPSIMATSTPCPQCGEQTDLKLVEPHPTDSENENHTFECKECGLPRTYIMKLNRAAIRFRDLQTVIGQELRAHYELPCELPHQLLTLLMQLNAQQNEQSGATVGNRQSRTS